MSDQPKKSKAELFAESYADLCDKHGHQIIVTPSYIKRDDGSYSTVLQYAIGELPKKEKE